MINWSAMTEAQILLFALILLRMIGFVFSSAIFGTELLNTSVKILLSLVLAVLVFAPVKTGPVNYDLISHEIIGLAAREIFIGLIMGFLTKLFFFIVTMAGDLVSVSIGLSSSQLFNPMLGSSGNVVDQFYSTLGTLVFLSIGGHHMLLSSLVQSFELIQVGQLSLNVSVLGDVVFYGQEVLVMAIKMCAPVIITALLINVSMGILGRAVPQINVLVTGVPVSVMLGLLVMFVCLPLLVVEMNGVMDITAEKLFFIMKKL